MSAPSFPSATEVRSGMRRMKVAMGDVETLQRAQIAQAIFGATVADRVEVAQAMVEALGALHESVVLYLALMGLEAEEHFPPVVEEA